MILLKSEIIHQIEYLEPQRLRTVLKELLTLNSNMATELDKLREKVRELDSRTVGMVK